MAGADEESVETFFVAGEGWHLLAFGFRLGIEWRAFVCHERERLGYFCATRDSRLVGTEEYKHFHPKKNMPEERKFFFINWLIKSKYDSCTRQQREYKNTNYLTLGVVHHWLHFQHQASKKLSSPYRQMCSRVSSARPEHLPLNCFAPLDEALAPREECPHNRDRVRSYLFSLVLVLFIFSLLPG